MGLLPRITGNSLLLTTKPTTNMRYVILLKCFYVPYHYTIILSFHQDGFRKKVNVISLLLIDLSHLICYGEDTFFYYETHFICRLLMNFLTAMSILCIIKKRYKMYTISLSYSKNFFEKSDTFSCGCDCI